MPAHITFSFDQPSFTERELVRDPASHLAYAIGSEECEIGGAWRECADEVGRCAPGV